MRSSNDDTYQEAEDRVKKSTVQQSDDSDVSTAHAMPGMNVSAPSDTFVAPLTSPAIAPELTSNPQPEPSPSPSFKLHYEGLNEREIAIKAAEDIALLKMKRKFDDDLRAIDDHFDRLKNLYCEIQTGKGAKVEKKVFGLFTLHFSKYKEDDIKAMKRRYVDEKNEYELMKQNYERRRRASGIDVLAEHIKYVEENIDYIKSVTNDKLINEYARTYINDLDNNNSNGSDFVYIPKTNQANTAVPSNDYGYNYVYDPNDPNNADGTNCPR